MLVKHERRPFRFGVTLLAGLLGCLSLMGCKDEKTGAQAPTVPAVEVAVEIVTPQKVLYTTELAGRTSGFQIAEVRPQVSGIIQKRFFVEGADVKAGDVLYQIDPATYQANLDSAKANLARAEANVARRACRCSSFKDYDGDESAAVPASRNSKTPRPPTSRRSPTWASTRPPWKTRASVWPIPK